MSDHNHDDVPADLVRLVQRNIADISSIVPLGAGLDNAAWLINGVLVVRHARQPRPDTIRREVALLHIVGRHSPLAIPEVIFSDAENGLLAYRALPGRPALDLPDAQLSLDHEPLGRFLAAIHAIPIDAVRGLVPREEDSLADWLDEAKKGYAQIAGSLPASSRRRIEAFLAAAPPPSPEPEELVFCHNDLGAEHILLDPTTMRIAGIIDWTDAAIADPMRDFALILRDFGPVMLRQVLSAYDTELSPNDHQRLLFHARCKLIEDLAYGRETGSTRYFNAALAHLDWTFA